MGSSAETISKVLSEFISNWSTSGFRIFVFSAIVPKPMNPRLKIAMYLARSFAEIFRITTSFRVLIIGVSKMILDLVASEREVAGTSTVS